MAKERDLVLFDRRMHDGEGVGAGGTFQVLKLIDGDGGSLGGAQHRGIFEALSKGRHAGWEGEEQSCGEDDAVHRGKTHKVIFRILAEGGQAAVAFQV